MIVSVHPMVVIHVSMDVCGRHSLRGRAEAEAIPEALTGVTLVTFHEDGTCSAREAPGRAGTPTARARGWGASTSSPRAILSPSAPSAGPAGPAESSPGMSSPCTPCPACRVCTPIPLRPAQRAGAAPPYPYALPSVQGAGSAPPYPYRPPPSTCRSVSTRCSRGSVSSRACRVCRSPCSSARRSSS